MEVFLSGCDACYVMSRVGCVLVDVESGMCFRGCRERSCLYSCVLIISEFLFLGQPSGTWYCVS